MLYLYICFYMILRIYRHGIEAEEEEEAIELFFRLCMFAWRVCDQFNLRF
jgi:hypothetical protein